jgi:S-adenosylmethionine:tRNA ribosyltransferase-isomerase
VSVFIKREQMVEIYQHAVEQKYRFLSYGDAMLLNKQTKKYNVIPLTMIVFQNHQNIQ